MDITSTPPEPLPKRVMGGVYWRFSGSTFASRAEFDDEIRRYQTTNWGKEWWQPDEIVLLAKFESWLPTNASGCRSRSFLEPAAR